MSDTQETQSAQRSEFLLPQCTKCRTPMVLVRLHPGRHGSYRGKYICAACGKTLIDDVKLARLEVFGTEW